LHGCAKTVQPAPEFPSSDLARFFLTAVIFHLLPAEHLILQGAIIHRLSRLFAQSLIRVYYRQHSHALKICQLQAQNGQLLKRHHQCRLLPTAFSGLLFDLRYQLARK